MAVSPNEEKSFVIIEDVPNGLVVRLEDSGTPFGRPRDQASFDGGGSLQKESVFLPGRSTPIFQVQQARHRDLELHGHFRDHLRAQDIGAQDLGWARSMVRDLEEIRRRANLLTIAWAQERWTGLLIETKFSWQSEHDIEYQLTFAVASTVGE